MKKLILSFSLGLLCLFFQGCTRNPVLAEVGDYKITKEEANFRNRVIRIYYPQETRNLGIDQLVRAFTYAQILKNNGQEVTDDVLTKEVNRIDQHTLVPETLARIKGIFGPDTKSYRRVFVLPTLTERVIYFEFFLHDPKPQAVAVKPAEDFLHLALQKPKEYLNLASTKGYKVQDFEVSVKEGLKELKNEPKKKGKKGEDDARSLASNNPNSAPAHLDMRMKAQMEEQRAEEAKRWIENILKGLKPGEIYSKLVDQGQQWYVVKFLKQTPSKKGAYTFNAVAFNKAEYGEWIEAETKKVKITRFDVSETTPAVKK